MSALKSPVAAKHCPGALLNCFRHAKFCCAGQLPRARPRILFVPEPLGQRLGVRAPLRGVQEVANRVRHLADLQ